MKIALTVERPLFAHRLFALALFAACLSARTAVAEAPGANVVAAAKPAPTVAPPKQQRVLVLDAAAAGISNPLVGQLEDVISADIRAHPEFDVVPDADMHRALAVAEVAQPQCRHDVACIAALGRQLKADVTLASVVRKSGDRYVLEMQLVSATGATPLAQASETMRQLKSLPMNVASCLRSMFKWKDVEPAAPAPSPYRVVMAAVPDAEADQDLPGTSRPPPVVPVPKTPLPSEKIKVAVIDLKANGIPDELASTLTSVLSTELSRLSVFAVITNQEIRAVLGHDALLQAVGCGAGEACSADLGNLLGARYLVSGDVGKVGTGYTVNLALTDTQGPSVISRQTATVADTAGLLQAASRTVQMLVSRILSERQGTLIFTCTERGATVTIDGSAVGSTPLPRLKVAWGPHRLQVEKKGFITEVEDFTMETNGVVQRAATLIPSPDFLKDYEAGARGMRVGAWITTAAAVAALGGGVFFQVNQMRLTSQFGTEKQKYEAEVAPSQADFDSLSKTRTQALQSLNLTYILVAGASACAAGALYFWIAGADPEKYAHFRGLGLNNTGRADDNRLALRFDGGGGLVGASLAFR
jgi:TolB-like protein